jgi:hypothetical protein
MQINCNQISEVLLISFYVTINIVPYTNICSFILHNVLCLEIFLFPQELPAIEAIEDARVLLNLGDSVTTDHISPAGSIARNSPAARYLAARGYVPLRVIIIHHVLDLNTSVP